jgi:hypothetical protein
VIDLGEGVRRVLDLEFTRRDRELVHRVRAGAGAAR